ncbi:MAG: hypothetical protein OSJ62_16735 [Lachnospiraceae bacterium]|nr:hypothetical protein [Lachnospiraceae bacterium]
MNEKSVDYLNGRLFPMILKFSIPAAIFYLEKGLCLQIISCGFSFFVAQMAMGFISLVKKWEISCWFWLKEHKRMLSLIQSS